MWPTNGSTNSRIDNQPCTNKRSDKVIRVRPFGSLDRVLQCGRAVQVNRKLQKEGRSTDVPSFCLLEALFRLWRMTTCSSVDHNFGGFSVSLLLKLDVHARLAVQIDLRGLSLLHPHPPAHQHQHHCYLCIREANRKAFFQLIFHIGLERFWYICLKRGDFYSLMLSLENGFEEDDRFSGRVSKSKQSKPLQS